MRTIAKVNGGLPDVLLKNQACLWAFVLSIAAHLGLVLCSGHWKGHARGGMPPSWGAGETSLSVWLAPPKSETAKSPDPAVSIAPPAPGATHGAAMEKAEDGKSAAHADITANAQVIPPAPETSSVALVSMPEPHYFLPDELTRKPQLSRDIPSEYAPDLPDVFTRPLAVRLLINERGDVDKVVIEEAMLSGKAVRFITDTFSEVKFHPGKLGNMPVKSQLRISVSLQKSLPAAPVVSAPVVLDPHAAATAPRLDE